MTDILTFVKESNWIEGIKRDPTRDELEAHAVLLSLASISVEDLENFVHVIAPGKPLRRHEGCNVRVGNYVAPKGGEGIEKHLGAILNTMCAARKITPRAKQAYSLHHDYERLHPFMDGNGRSGRALWLWMLGGPEYAPLGFLHHWYYQSLEFGRVAA